MTPSRTLAAALALVLVGYWVGRGCGDEPAEMQELRSEQAASSEQDAGAMLWTCSMHPHIHAEEPGRCPICGMDLVPVEVPGEKSDAARPVLEMSAEAMQRAEIRTALVERRAVHRERRLVGKIEVDETRMREITAWVPGRLERLYVDFTGIAVQRGQRLVLLYSPELVSTQEELLAARRAERALEASRSTRMRESAAATLEAAREKLRLLGLSSSQIVAIEQRGTVQHRIAIRSPLDGVVLQKHGVEGMYVETGSPIYTVADLSRVWAKLDAYESDLPWIHAGQEVSFESDALPGRVFHGEVSFIDPVLNARTRTAKVRVEVANPEGVLKPEMFVHAVLRSETGAPETAPPLVIPASAPLLTGRRAIVYVRSPGTERPTFEGREVVLGPRAGDFYVVESGLREGERVVINGAFKLDSALQIQGKRSMMLPEGGVPGAAAHPHAGMPREESEGSRSEPAGMPAMEHAQ